MNLGAWGCATTRQAGGTRLPELLERLLRETGVPRIRLSSLGPQYLTTAFFDAWSDPRVCDHLHLSVQSGSPAVLARMGRGIALRQVGASNIKPLRWKEARVALLHGIVLGTILALIVLLWFHNIGLSAVIFIALTCNLLFAAIAGVMVPVMLKRAGYDPALASSIFLTTVTDVMGFFTFLGLATLVLLR